MSTLEDRYRRLLACYPAEHRSAHGQEMLDVLLSAARPGQTRPSVAETADLIRGGLRIRMRRATAGSTGSIWPGALAITGFLATLMLLADGVRFVVNAPHLAPAVAERLDEGEPLTRMLGLYFGTGPYWLVWAAIAFLAWRGSRRPAALAACAVTAAQLVLAAYGTSFPHLRWAEPATSLAGVPLTLAILATASLVASPGLSHGARLLGRGRVIATAALAAIAVLLTSSPLFTLIYQGDLGSLRFGDVDALISFAETWGRLQMVAVLATAVLIIAMLSRTHQGRRVCAVLAFAGAPLVVRLGVFHIGASADYPLPPHHLLAVGLISSVLAMLLVHITELPTRKANTRPRPNPTALHSVNRESESG